MYSMWSMSNNLTLIHKPNNKSQWVLTLTLLAWPSLTINLLIRFRHKLIIIVTYFGVLKPPIGLDSNLGYREC